MAGAEVRSARAATDVARLLYAAFLAGTIGIFVELLLAGHTEDAWQWAPLAVLMAGFVSALVRRRVARRGSKRAFDALMGLFLVSTAAGLWLHYQANIEFELEMYPDLRGWALFSKAVQGKSPPSLAPGAMALLGLVGLAWSRLRGASEPETREPTARALRAETRQRSHGGHES